MLTVKNRHTETFVGMYDGQRYPIKPGTTLTLPDFVARHIRNQSVYLENPVTGERHFRLAIVEEGDDDSPLDELPIESLDRTDMALNKVVHVKTNARPAPPERRGSWRFDSLPITKER